MKRVLVRTFGCKLNRYESQIICESFASSGYGLTADACLADIHVINTCSVTARSDSEARQFVRRAFRANPGAVIVVTGCYAQRAPREIADIGGVGLVAGNAEKSCLPRLVESLAPGEQARIEVNPPDAVAGRWGCGPDFQGRSRALIKIQDGCDGRCSYCVVPSVRGKSRSESTQRVVEEASRLEAYGFREAVLTGARVGVYGEDLGNGHCLESLLRTLVGASDNLRFRLSSLEPGELQTSLLELVAREQRICAHFHVPLQSGDEEVLRAMKRHYSPAEYADRIRAVNLHSPDACIGSDVIVGFPGESEAGFRKTYELIEKSPLSYLHVFPFSRRPGTEACSAEHQCPDSTKKARAAAMRELGERKRNEFIESQVGALQDAVLEREVEPGTFTATTGNYLRVHVRTERHTLREAVRVRICGRTGGRLVAEPC